MVIDTDVDISDVAAVAVLLRDPGVDVRAITIVPTGTGVTNCASGRRVLQYLLEELAATGIPFGCGRADPGPDGERFPDEWRGAADSGWGLDMPARPQSSLPKDAMTVLTEAIAASPRPPIIVALGPWTNLEDAIASDPAFAVRIAGIHAMAGAVDVPGNVIVGDLTAEDGLEWNLAADRSAVVAVFGTAASISLVPLDATDDVPIPQDLATSLGTRPAAGGDLIYELLLRAPTRSTGDGQQLWDELAALALTEPGLVTWQEATMIGERTGRVRRDSAGRPVRVATAADRPAVERALLAALGRGPARLHPFVLAGEITVEWDGSSCTATTTGDPTQGLVGLTFLNRTGVPSSANLIEVKPPHTWTELVALLRTLDVEAGAPPDWTGVIGVASDFAGTGAPARSAVSLPDGIRGPVCVTGTWPDLEFTAGEPFPTP